MPYVKKLVDEINDKVSDFGWEVGNAEYELDMLPDGEEECPMLAQHDNEVHLACGNITRTGRRDIE
jgi:hypothetical protein